MAPKKGSSNNNYYWFLLLPIAALVVVAILLIPRSKDHNWDDDEDDEDTEGTVQTANGALQVSDELLNSFDPNAPFEQTGHSRAFRIQPREDMIVSAEAGAFEQDVNIRVTDVPTETMNELDRQLEGSGTTMIFAYDLDAGLPPDSVIPGKYTVSIDLEKHGIPEELYPSFVMYRVAGDGSLQPLNVKINGHTATYMASQNSVTLAAIAVSAVRIATAVGIIVYAYAHYPAILQKARRIADAGIWPSNWWKWSDAVCLHVPDDFGNFYVCYRYSMTENGDKAEEYVKKKNKLEKLMREIREEVDRDFSVNNRTTWEIEDMANRRYNGNIRLALEEIRLKCEAEYQDRLDHNEEVQELKHDPLLQIPKSVEDIITATKLANRYCRTNQHMKPFSYEYVIWLTPALEAWGQDALRHQIIFTDPCLVVNYDNVVKNGDYSKDMFWKNLSTIAHETMHLYQMEYVNCSMVKDDCYFEATGALVEPHFTDWLIKTVRLPGIPVTNAFAANARQTMGYTERSEKELLSTPLGKDCPTYQGVKLLKNERGYMLADLMQYLWDNQPHPNDTLDFAKMMNRYSYDKGMLKTMQDIFGIDGDRAFTKYYEGFCEMFISEIEAKQSVYRAGQHGDNLVFPDLNHDPEHCVMRIKHLGEKGSTTGQPFMVNTFFIKPTPSTGSNGRSQIKPYHIFVVRSEKVRQAEVKFTFYKDEKFAEDPMYFVPDYARLSICNAVVMTRPDSKDLTMGNDYYIDLVALYAPKEKPTLQYTTNGDFSLSLREWPVRDLMDNKYVTGVEFMLEDSVTGKHIDSTKVKLPIAEREPVIGNISLSGYTDEQLRNIIGHARWYYQPNPADTTCYYSPWSEKADEETGLIVNSFSYIIQPGPGRAMDFDPNTNPKARLKVWSDGRFEFTVPASSSGPAFKASGKGRIREGMEVYPANFDNYVGKIDPASFTSTVLTVSEQEMNERGEMINVSVEYKITSPEGGYILFDNCTDPSVPIDVQACFNATRKSPLSGSRTTTVLYIGQDKAVTRRSSNPFADEPID